GVFFGIAKPDMHASVRMALATAAGSSLWLMTYLIASRIFATAGGTSQNRQEEVVGRRGHVAAPIDGPHPGTVTYVVRGTRQSLPAVTDDEDPIPVGATVR